MYRLKPHADALRAGVFSNAGPATPRFSTSPTSNAANPFVGWEACRGEVGATVPVALAPPQKTEKGAAYLPKQIAAPGRVLALPIAVAHSVFCLTPDGRLARSLAGWLQSRLHGFPRSSNGRTSAFGAEYLGSNPGRGILVARHRGIIFLSFCAWRCVRTGKCLFCADVGRQCGVARGLRRGVFKVR